MMTTDNGERLFQPEEWELIVDADRVAENLKVAFAIAKRAGANSGSAG